VRRGLRQTNMSLVVGGLFQTRGPAAEKFLSLNQVLILGTTHKLALTERR